MNISELATKYMSLLIDLEELNIDMFANEEEKEEKQKEMEKVRNELLLYDEYKELYKKSEELEIDITLLYPFKEIIDENGNKIYISKDSEEYKEDIGKYLDDLEVLYNEGKLDKKTYDTLKEEAMEIADKQMDKIEEEEKEKEEEIDLNQEYEHILDSIKKTRDSIVYNHIGENSYGILKNKYKSMTELERKDTLYKTNTCICKTLDVTSDMKFTKYDIDTKDCVNNKGYCILTKDIKGSEYPLEVVLFEQISKIYMKEVLNKVGYTPLQKEKLNLMLANNIDLQKILILDKYKKRELDIYNS